MDKLEKENKYNMITWELEWLSLWKYNYSKGHDECLVLKELIHEKVQVEVKTYDGKMLHIKV